MSNAPRLSREQSRRIDALAIDELGIPGVVLMENAGINAADVATGMLEAVAGNKIAIICGGGNNGGDGYVIARHLFNAGRTAVVYTAANPASLSGDAAINYQACHRMGVKIMRIDDAESLAEQSPHWRSADVIVDALLGTGFDASRGLRPHAAAVIRTINDARPSNDDTKHTPLILAVDVPSGLDCQTGEPAEPTVRADATVTFVARKVGFDAPGAQPLLGEVFVAGIGIPPALIDRVSKE